MLRRSFPRLQFTLGKYRGPIPAKAATNNNNNKAPRLHAEIQEATSPNSPSAQNEQALRIAQTIAARVARENEEEERRKSSLYRNRVLKAESGARSGRIQEQQQHQLRDADGDDVDGDGVEFIEQPEDDEWEGGVGGTGSGRADFEIPTLAPPAPPEAWIFQPQLLDANRLPTTLLAAQDHDTNNSKDHDAGDDDAFAPINRLLSPALATALKQRRTQWNIHSPTPVQSLVLQAALAERRDVCAIAPTGTGKSLCYILPAIQSALEFNGLEEDFSPNMTETKLRARDAARAQLEERRIASTNAACRYCGLNVRYQRICPQTGAPHPPVQALVTTSISAEEQEQGDGDSEGDDKALAQRHGSLADFLRNRSSGGRGGGVVAEPSSLILCPNGPLVDQVHGVTRSLHCGLRIAYCRSVSDPQMQHNMVRLIAGCDVLVGTPAMTLVMIKKRRVSLKNLRFLAIDEVDHSLDVAHFDLVSMILSQLPSGASGGSRNTARFASAAGSSSYYSSSPLSQVQRAMFQPPVRTQRMLVGATLPPPLVKTVANLMHPDRARWVVGSVLSEQLRGLGKAAALKERKDRAKIASQQQQQEAGEQSSALPVEAEKEQHDTFSGGFTTIASSITHSILMTSNREKTDKIRWLYDTGRILPTHSVVIFCNTRASVAFLADTLATSTLAHHAVKVVCIFPDQSDESRAAAWQMFRTGASQILVTTDAFARGVDFDNAFAVIQYDFPHAFDVFVHRSGRCGRRGKPGHNFCFFEPQDARMARQLAAYLRQRRQDVPPLLDRYAKQSWSDLYREQIHGASQRKFNIRNAEVRKSPLGLAEQRFPKSDKAWKANWFRVSRD